MLYIDDLIDTLKAIKRLEGRIEVCKIGRSGEICRMNPYDVYVVGIEDPTYGEKKIVNIDITDIGPEEVQQMNKRQKKKEYYAHKSTGFAKDYFGPIDPQIKVCWLRYQIMRILGYKVVTKEPDIGLEQTKSKEKKMQDITDPMLDLAITLLRLDDATSADGIHLSDKQRLSLLETVWENIPYEVFDKMLTKTGTEK